MFRVTFSFRNGTTGSHRRNAQNRDAAVVLATMDEVRMWMNSNPGCTIEQAHDRLSHEIYFVDVQEI